LNLPGFCAKELADVATAMIMGLIRNTNYYDREIRKGNWPKCQYLLPPDVRELTLGLYGFGLAGRYLHDIFHNGFGTKVISCDPYVSDEIKAQYSDVEFVTFEELITRSDIISIHVILTPETTHVFNKDVFKKMKDTAMIINTSRGPVIDNDDLAWALQTGEIRYAGLDTVEREPLPENDPFKTLDNIIVNPHCGSYGVGSKKTQINMVCELLPNAATTRKIPARCVADRAVIHKDTGYEFT
jgi:phosphoglycerate dehydrogenase-like enzyme